MARLKTADHRDRCWCGAIHQRSHFDALRRKHYSRNACRQANRRSGLTVEPEEAA